MPRTINADGRTITVPDDATPEEINEIVGPAPSGAPSRPTATVEAAPSFGQQLKSLVTHPLNSLEAASQTKSRPANASIPEMAETDMSNVLAAAGGVLRHPINTVGSILSQGFGVRPLVESAINAATGKPLYQPAPVIPTNPEEGSAMIGQMLALSALPEVIPKVADASFGVARALPKVGEKMAEKYAPRSVPVGEEKIPVTVGEADPESDAGRLQSSLKRSGAGAPKFEKVEKVQQEGVKNVIKKTAQRASGFVGPMQEEAGAVVNDAATASFRKAEPLYNELDESIKSAPASFEGVSKIVQDAVAKARKLGVPIAEEAGDISKIRPDKNGAIDWGGSKISKTTHPERWAQLVQKGIIDDSGTATPFRAYRMVRSQLLKMQRSATDGATRFAIGNEVKTMDANIDAALKGTGLEKNWGEANRLWREGHARIKVADAIKGSTKGTPESAQAPGMAKVPTELQGSNLVKKLNDLADDGTLSAAFTPDEIRNLRQSADILDRIQRTPSGKGAGESLSLSRGLTHAVRGNIGPLIGAGIGGTLGLIEGHPFYGAEAGAGIGFVIQRVGEQGLIRIMTKIDGVKAMKALESAKTPQEGGAAIKTMLALGAATAPKPKKRVDAALAP